jgi:hypothetical protein
MEPGIGKIWWNRGTPHLGLAAEGSIMDVVFKLTLWRKEAKAFAKTLHARPAMSP